MLLSRFLKRGFPLCVPPPRGDVTRSHHWRWATALVKFPSLDYPRGPLNDSDWLNTLVVILDDMQIIGTEVVRLQGNHIDLERPDEICDTPANTGTWFPSVQLTWQGQISLFSPCQHTF